MTIDEQTITPTETLPPNMIGRPISRDLIPHDLRYDPEGDLALELEFAYPQLLFAENEETEEK